MEDIIRSIISIEDKAQEIIRDAREASETLDKRVETDEKRLEQRIMSKAEARCSLVREEEHEGAEVKIRSIKAETDAKLGAMDKIYTENKEKWVGDIVRHIIGG